MVNTNSEFDTWEYGFNLIVIFKFVYTWKFHTYNNIVCHL